MVVFAARIWTLLLLAVLVGCVHTEDSVVQHGVVDLHNAELTAPLALNGLWKFHWGAFLSPLDTADYEYLQVPGSWNNQENGRSGSGVATYRVTIVNPPPDLALSLNHARSAYTLYANGHIIASNGTLGSTASTSHAVYKPVTVSLGNYGDRLDLVFHVSNFTHRSGGLSQEVLIGPLAVLNAEQNKAIAWDAFITGALVLFGFYHLALFFLHREKTALLFMGCYLFFALRILATHSLLLMNIFPGLGAETLLRLEYAGVFGISFFTIAHVYLFPKIVPRKPSFLYVGFNMLLLLGSFVLPAPIFTYAALLWEASAAFGVLLYFFYAVVAVCKGVADSRLYLVAYGLICVSIVNEVLYGTGIIRTFPSITVTALIVLVLQSMLLSRTFVQAVANVRMASFELETQAQRERELRRIQLRLQGMLDKLPNAVAATNEEGILIYGNQPFYASYGSAEHLLHTSISKVFPASVAEESVTGVLGETITKSMLEMGDESLWLYLVSWPNKSAGFQSAQELVASLQHNRIRLQKLSSMLAMSAYHHVSTELVQIESALSQTALRIYTDSLSQKRILAPALMQAALAYWQELTKKSKFDLARESRLWNVEMSADGWMRTRTLDKYLLPASLPKNPRWDNVVQTVEYVLSESDRELSQRAKIIELLEEFRKLG